MLTCAIRWILVIGGLVAAIEISTDCGGYFNQTGLIQIPNFPRFFKVPILCRWVIEAPRNKDIVFMIPQLYLRSGLKAVEYEDYYSEHKDLIKFNHSELRFNYDKTVKKVVWGLLAKMRYLVLELHLMEWSNVNLRVEDAFLDTYGFNATIEMIDENANKTFDELCDSPYCSFNGQCLASADLSRYLCNCFPGFYGPQCKYRGICDERQGRNPCQRGDCRYSTLKI